jgi:hypothetical protein
MLSMRPGEMIRFDSALAALWEGGWRLIRQQKQAKG